MKNEQTKTNKEIVLSWAKDHWSEFNVEFMLEQNDRFYDYLVTRFKNWRELSDVAINWIIFEY